LDNAIKVRLNTGRILFQLELLDDFILNLSAGLVVITSGVMTILTFSRARSVIEEIMFSSSEEQPSDLSTYLLSALELKNGHSRQAPLED
jgi:hypothetical protein